jgi:2-dehydro-3-deoxyphosphooctonate aldolase (KDO 8-P synthase)
MKDKMIVIAGPCVVESKEMLRQTAEHLLEIQNKLDFEFIFKSSYKKANRTSVDSFTGLGDDIALQYLNDIKSEYNVEVITDVHTAEEATKAAEFVDYLQIPAFLARQTDLLLAAGETGKTVNIKKAQFMAPEDMKKAAAKVESTGNKKIFLTERGTSFGYHDLVVDYRSLVIMQEYGYPVIYDATHSLQKPSIGKQSGGLPQFIPPLARAAIATGIDGLFFETHPNPQKAKSDAATQLSLDKAEPLLASLKEIYDLVNRK